MRALILIEDTEDGWVKMRVDTKPDWDKAPDSAAKKLIALLREEVSAPLKEGAGE